MVLYRARDSDKYPTPMGIDANYLDMMADIHFCSSVLYTLVTIVKEEIPVENSPIEMEQHAQNRDQLLLIVLVFLLQKLEKDILQVHVVNGCIAWWAERGLIPTRRYNCPARA
jgi:hypothetical protein